MKKALLALVVLFFLMMAVCAVMQSNIGRNFVRNALTRALVDSGYVVHIDQIEGTLPHQINLKGVTIQGENFEATAAEIRLRPVLWRLLKKEVAFNDIRAKKISISQGTPFDFSGRFRINRKRIFVRGEIGDWSLFLRYYIKLEEAEFTAANETFVARGAAEFLPKFSSNIQIHSKDLLAIVKVHQEGDSYLGIADWQLAKVDPIGPMRGTAEAIYRNWNLKGSVSAENHAKATFDLNYQEGALFTGTSEFNIENLQALHIFDAYGKLQAKARWDVVEKTQVLHLDSTLSHFYYEDLFAETFSIQSDLTDPFGKSSGPIRVDAQKLKWKRLNLDHAGFETSIGEESSPYKLFAEGTLPYPFELTSEGTWKDQWIIRVENLSGRLMSTPFTLDAPLEITSTSDVFQIPDAAFTIGSGTARINILRQKDQTDASFHLSEFPLDFLSLNPLEVTVAGTMTFDAELQERNNKLNGNFTASINQIAPVVSSGQFKGTFNKNLLQVTGAMTVRETPFLDLNVSLPIYFSIWPFKTEILLHKNAKGTFSFNGRVEEILDYFDLGPHRLEGNLQGSLTFRNTLYRPLVEGKFVFENGQYENYYSGTTLTHITADVLAEKNTLYVRTITAHDRSGTGTLSGNGELHLLQSDLYPFRLDFELVGLQFAEIDLVKATINGKVRLEGNALTAVAKGNVQIIQSELSIPDHIPRPLPNLEVVYRNAIHPIEPPKKDYQPYPLRLDLNITTPADILISGRGLNSRWKGAFHLGGTYTSLAAKGNLTLIEGEFNFSSRSFKLIEGSLGFSGIEHQMPYINLAGQMQTKGITITARLKGPLDDPQITLLSNPPLPLGSIMSYLLFGQDISEIGGFQALQLATSLASLAGTGPDVMEATRKSLGVDRLRVVTEPTEEGGETVALQVGKYISKGVLVSFTQGTDESSTNISVEIELKNNFIFQIESDQRQEQGRFTLKWNLNY